jgi:hypothetical protein
LVRKRALLLLRTRNQASDGEVVELRHDGQSPPQGVEARSDLAHVDHRLDPNNLRSEAKL